jgi:hypothetical protein
MTDLFLQVKERALNPKTATDMNKEANFEPPFRHVANPPLTLAEVAQAEVQLGFILFDSFKRLYLEIGDGNFGAGYGMMPLLDGAFAATASGVVPTFLEWKKKGWRFNYLPFCYHGCSIFSLIDVQTGRIGVFDTEAMEEDDVEDYILWQKDSLEDWLMAWVKGENLFFPLEEDDA